MSDAVLDPASLRKAEDFRWAGVDSRRYKEENAAPFKAVSRQVLFSDPRLAGELRYFEVEPDGYSTLERHEHMHAVMILRGEGQVLVGTIVHAVKPHDLITIPPWTWHQFRPAPGEKLGFLCLVNADRDRPQLPTLEELSALRADLEVAHFLDGVNKDESAGRR
ncbi:cupin domain-containing protein [Methylocapsa sp. S129]|uniref:cupin domain-containing protein n=1 Tax=Methylocapsa sp. S129 TaxID=1641869 RepID=UPI00131B2035|nr:cupin domain-containing protein [Methylocapsa sp. S129]